MTTEIMGEPCPPPPDLEDFDGLCNVCLKQGCVELDINVIRFVGNDPAKPLRNVAFYKNCWRAGSEHSLDEAFDNMRKAGMFWTPEKDEFRRIMTPVHERLLTFFESGSTVKFSFSRTFNSMFNINVEAWAEREGSLWKTFVRFGSDSSDDVKPPGHGHTMFLYSRTSSESVAAAFRKGGWDVIDLYRDKIRRVSEKTRECAVNLYDTARAMFPELVERNAPEK